MKASLKTTETDGLKIILLQRGLTVEGLAKDCGVKEITLRNQLAGNFQSRRMRLVIEGVLTTPIWSSVDSFESRQRLTSRCGFDPFMLTASQLQKRCAGMKLRGRSLDRRKSALISLVEKHCIQPTNSIHQTKNPTAKTI